jgi:hypothetical protein
MGWAQRCHRCRVSGVSGVVLWLQKGNARKIRRRAEIQGRSIFGEDCVQVQESEPSPEYTSGLFVAGVNRLVRPTHYSREAPTDRKHKRMILCRFHQKIPIRKCACVLPGIVCCAPGLRRDRQICANHAYMVHPGLGRGVVARIALGSDTQQQNLGLVLWNLGLL